MCAVSFVMLAHKFGILCYTSCSWLFHSRPLANLFQRKSISSKWTHPEAYSRRISCIWIAAGMWSLKFSMPCQCLISACNGGRAAASDFLYPWLFVSEWTSEPCQSFLLKRVPARPLQEGSVCGRALSFDIQVSQGVGSKSLTTVKALVFMWPPWPCQPHRSPMEAPGSPRLRWSVAVNGWLVTVSYSASTQPTQKCWVPSIGWQTQKTGFRILWYLMFSWSIQNCITYIILHYIT